MKKVLMFIALFAVLVAVAATLVFASAKKVEVVSAGVDSISDLSLTGAALNGHLEIYNGGFLPVGVENITYTVYIEDIDGIIGEGVLDGGMISPKETEAYPFSIKISWVPTIDTALDLILSNSTFANIEGVVNVASIGVARVAIPFSARVNMKGYIEQFVVGVPYIIPGDIVSDVIDIVEDVIGNLTDGADAVVGAIEGMLE